MTFIFCVKRKQKLKVYTVGKNLDNMTMLVGISRLIANKIVKEKGIGLEKALRLIVESILEGNEVMDK